MPDLPTWIERVPGLLASLQQPDSPPFFDRSSIERLFHLRRRQAIHLMHKIKGYKLAGAFVVDRGDLVRFLGESLPPSRQARERKRAVGEWLAEAHQEVAGKRRILIPIRPDVARRKIQGLPAGIDLGPGRLTIGFLEPAELLEQLVELSQALANDYATFEAAVKPTGQKQVEMDDECR
ncbi:MAG: hypothetical protein ABSD75_33950 [Terriglobales bacterium]|jgi:hypothetical protein